ncbi:MAG: FAD-binding oxidoreductase [Phormidesmis sp. CAN_BIN36]|nr:FAD-binding oxidoreductase [Phormidesmis sp. CAN_BIN36]
MTTYDWIVVGAGITGAALAYELAKQGFSTLLLEQHSSLTGATRYSYGGIAYWSGTTALTRQLCTEGIERHRILSDELAADTLFRELDLLLTVAAHSDPQVLVRQYASFAIPPRLLSVKEACELEPLLNPIAIAGALTVRHGHIEAELTTQAYVQAMQRTGGDLKIAQVTGFVKEGASRITGVTTTIGTLHAANIAICAGGITRQLLQESGIRVKQYFTHAEIIETPPTDLRLSTLVMPAEAERFQLEASATQPEVEDLWNEPGHEPTSAILDAGAVQLLDGRIRIGQTSRTLTDPNAPIEATQSQADLRTKISAILPAIGKLPGTWHHCTIAFSCDRLPLVGATPEIEGIYLFSGFSNPHAIVPAIARRFAASLLGETDEIIEQLSPGRFSL